MTVEKDSGPRLIERDPDILSVREAATLMGRTPGRLMRDIQADEEYTKAFVIAWGHRGRARRPEYRISRVRLQEFLHGSRAS